ncbi:hypothetical protein [Marinicrinis sediminis]|uniref:Uncharacterized protein n=1 Tax=Marinicrinis sediminis TaxID=1652465 RepID=A0ABW5R9D1_9BACL
MLQNPEAIHIQFIHELSEKYTTGTPVEYEGHVYQLQNNQERLNLIKTVLHQWDQQKARGEREPDARGMREETQNEASSSHRVKGGYPRRKHSSKLLQRVSNLLLADELKSRNPHKLKQTEYPILSGWQLHYRQQREYSLVLASSMDCDGNRQDRPVRRRRTLKEELTLELQRHGNCKDMKMGIVQN